MREHFWSQIEFVILKNSVDTIRLPVIHIVGKHFYNFSYVELSGPAKSQIESVIEPRVLVESLLDDEVLELTKNLYLIFGEFS